MLPSQKRFWRWSPLAITFSLTLALAGCMVYPGHTEPLRPAPVLPDSLRPARAVHIVWTPSDNPVEVRTPSGYFYDYDPGRELASLVHRWEKRGPNGPCDTLRLAIDQVKTRTHRLSAHSMGFEHTLTLSVSVSETDGAIRYLGGKHEIAAESGDQLREGVETALLNMLLRIDAYVDRDTP
jgi:hypothetical protein